LQKLLDPSMVRETEEGGNVKRSKGNSLWRGLWCKLGIAANSGRWRYIDRFCYRLRGQRRAPDFRQRRAPPAQLADFELPLLDLLREFDAADHDESRLKAL